MASNQAVDSREVTAFPRRGRWLWLAPGALPTHCPCHIPAGRALLTLKKFPDTASEMGIDTGLLVHGCSRTCPWQSCAVARAHGVCPWEGTGQGLGATRVTSTGRTLSLEHKEQLSLLATARASRALGPKGARTAQHSPCHSWGHTRT